MARAARRPERVAALKVDDVVAALTLSPADVVADLAFMHDVLHHIADRDAYLRALARYLSPRARIAIVDYAPDRSPHRNDTAMLVSKAQARDLLAGVGFTPVDDIALFEDRWFVVFARR